VRLKCVAVIDGFCSGSDAVFAIPPSTHRIDSYRARDVLEFALTEVDEIAGNPPLDLPEDVIGHADAARISDAFDTGGDINPISEDVTAIDDDVADIDADAEIDALFQRHAAVTLGHGLLDIDRAAHRVHGAAEFGQHPVSGVLDNPPSVLCDFRIYDGRQVFPEFKVCSLFVQTGQAAVSCHVGRQNRREPPFQVL
jgi:hypothetical protein